MEPGIVSRLLIEIAQASEQENAQAWREALRPGDEVGRYRIRREIGRGGFGAVYEAFDPELGRTVALKALKPGRSRHPVSEEWIRKEAEAVAKLDHPAIVTIFDLGTCPAGAYLVMELLQGETLAERIARGPLPVDESLRLAEQMAEGLSHAHSRGVLHRDLKPANVFLCSDGRVKLLDFGLAHLLGTDGSSGAGTPAYMAPEQAAGEPVDGRADVYAAAMVLGEMLTGRRPVDLVGAPRRVVKLVTSAMAGDAALRPQDGSAWRDALLALRRSRARRRLVPAALALGLVVLGGVGWFAYREARVRWALQVALPQAVKLAESFQFEDAYDLAEKVARIVPEDPQLLQLWPQVACLYDVASTPDGAAISVKPYRTPDAPWRQLGRTPLPGVRLPAGIHRWRIEQEGYGPLELGAGCLLPAVLSGAPAVRKLTFGLERPDDRLAGTVRVPGGKVQLAFPFFRHVPPVLLGDFRMDRTEVTNRAFQEFVDAGGYQRPEFWRVPFEMDGRRLPWQEALALFRDRTGRPGPAGWSTGRFPDGEGDYPVTGVSWFEANAYAAFRGKALPNAYQWCRAAGGVGHEVVRSSNFGRKALAPAGAYVGLGRFGTLDLAGNAKEWAWNEIGGNRLILGGAWNESDALFVDPDARSPFAREATFGFRLVAPLDATDDPSAAAPIPPARRDYAREQPVPPEVARAYVRMYSHDRTPLDARTEARDDRSGAWRKEKVSFTAAYGGERVTAVLFLPLQGRPPYQTVIYFPGSDAIHWRSSEKLDTDVPTFADVLRGGRAVVYPIYKSTFERGDGLDSDVPSPTASWRDHVVMWAKDLGRTIDYVETRSDLDAGRIALYGYSWGANLGPLLLAVEDRVQAGVLMGGGLLPQECFPEADPFHFGPLVKQPVLLINGRYDFLYPLDSSQIPLFRSLGTTTKRHALFETGHMIPNDLVQKELIAWLDEHLGPAR